MKVQSTYSVPTHHNRIGSRTKDFSAVSMQHNTCKNLCCRVLAFTNDAFIVSNISPAEPVTQPTQTSSKSLIPEWLRNNQGTKLNMHV